MGLGLDVVVGVVSVDLGERGGGGGDGEIVLLVIEIERVLVFLWNDSESFDFAAEDHCETVCAD